MKHYWMLLIILFVLLAEVRPQEYQRYNEVNMQPEVWHFATPVSGQVDGKGDMHLSLPVLTVPGSPGRDFELSFGYRSGIRYHDMASWLGLGWSMDPGSITRDVRGNFQAGSHYYGPDRVDDPASYAQLPDAWYVSLPGKGTLQLSRSNINGFNGDVFKDDFLAPYNSQGFYFSDHRPYRIEVMVQNRDDYPWPGGVVHLPPAGNYITRFIITDEQGVRYVFGNPTAASFRDYTGPSGSVVYPNAWRLLAIAGVNYAGDLADLLQIPAALPLGRSGLPSVLAGLTDWIRFEYGFDQHHPVATGGTPAQVLQNTYLNWIHTPTHSAQFISVADRKDADLVFAAANTRDESRYYRRLERIELRARGGELSQVVHLHHAQTADPLSAYPLGKGGPGGISRGKLTLHGFHYQSADGDSIPGYRFEYPAVGSPANPAWSYNPEHHYYDGLGYYNDQPNPGYGIDNNPEDGAAWSLQRIVFPTGGWESYSYTNDRIDQDEIRFDRLMYDLTTGLPTYEERIFRFAEWPVGGSRRQGGARVTEIRRGDGAGEEEVVSFDYGPGRVNCLPARLVPFINEYLVRANEYKVQERGDRGVFYDWITRNYADSTIETTWYSNTGHCNALLYRPRLSAEHWVFHSDNAANGTPVRGELLRSLNKRGSRYESVEHTYQVVEKEAAILLDLPGVLPQRFALNQVAQRVVATVTELRDLSGVISRKRLERTYVNATGQVARERSIAADWITDRLFRYAWEIPVYGGRDWRSSSLTGMRLGNQLSEIAGEDIFTRNIQRNQTSLHGSYRQTYAEEQPSALGAAPVWRLHERYDLVAPGDLSFPPAFNRWESGGSADPQWQLSYTVEAYANGNPVQFRDGLGSLLEMFYGDNDHNLSNSPVYDAFGHAVPTGMRLENRLAMEFDYDPRQLQVAAIRDENGFTHRYTFDGFGRLKGEYAADGALLREYRYGFSRTPRGSYQPLQPNYILTRVFQGSAAPVREERGYYNGMGSQLQELSSADGNSVYTVSKVDLLGRIVAGYLPYRLADGGAGAYDPHYARRDENGNLGNGPLERFAIHRYEHRQSSEPQELLHPPDHGQRQKRSRRSRLVYAADEFPQLYTAGSGIVLSGEYSRDETGREHAEFFDSRNNLVATRVYSGSSTDTVSLTVECQSSSQCPEGLASEVRTIVIDEQQQVQWACFLDVSGPYRRGVLRLYPHNQPGELLLDISSDGHYSGLLEMPAGSYTLYAEVERLGNHHDTPYISASLQVQRYDQLIPENTVHAAFDAGGNQIMVHPPNFFTPPAGTQAVDWLLQRSYNTANQLLEESSTDNGMRCYRYNALGLVRFSQDENQRLAGKVEFYSYDFSGRLLRRGEAKANFRNLNPRKSYSFESSRSNWLEVYHYDGAPTTIKAPWNAFGAPAYAGFDFANPNGKQVAAAGYSGGEWHVILQSFDQHGRVVAKRFLQQDLPVINCGYQYDLQGKVTGSSIAAGADSYRHTYRYDGRDQLVEAASAAGGTLPQLLDLRLQYTPAGRIARRETGERSNHSFLDRADYQYSLRGWLTSVGNATQDRYKNLQQYAYFADGRIRETVFTDVAGVTGRYRYRFDVLDRLLEANFQQQLAGQWSDPQRYDVRGLSYDANGNILSMQTHNENGVAIDQLTYHYGASNRLQNVLDSAGLSAGEKWDAESASLSYDGNGNIVRIGQEGEANPLQLSYDGSNRITSISGYNGTVLQLHYNADGQQLYRRDGNGPVQRFVCDGEEVLGAFQDGKLLWWSIMAGEQVGRWLPGTGDEQGGDRINPEKRYFLNNYMGSLRRVINQHGELIAGFEYYPFGSVMPGNSLISGSDVTRQRFSGRHQEAQSGLLHFGKRYYSPSLARWMSPDPQAVNYLAKSPYSFTANDPVSKIEKDGAYFDTIVDVISLGVSLYDVANDPSSLSNWAAVGLDVVGILAPGVAGLGAAYKAADKTVDVVKASSGVIGSVVESGAEMVMRGDRRLPEEVFEVGFTARGNSMDLLNHARDNRNPASAFVSTTTSSNVARDFAGEGGHVYVMRNICGMDVNATLRGSSPYKNELEVVFVDRINPENIVGARYVNANGEFSGPFIRNPNFIPDP